MKCSTSQAQAQAQVPSSSLTTVRRRTTTTTTASTSLMAHYTTAQGGLKLVFTAYNCKLSFSYPKNKMIRMSNKSSTFTTYNDDEFETDDLSCYRGLVLDISYRPINIVCWKRAICLEFMEKADVLEYYDQTVNSPSGSFYIPAVLRVPNLLQVVRRRRIKQTLSRKNIFFRDVFTCQYCSSGENLTVDHVLPMSRGGEWKWDNLVTACANCNSRKGQKTLEEANMKLIKVPKAPKDFDILAVPLTSSSLKTLRKRKGLPNEWHQYLGKLPSEP